MNNSLNLDVVKYRSNNNKGEFLPDIKAGSKCFTKTRYHNINLSGQSLIVGLKNVITKQTRKSTEQETFLIRSEVDIQTPNIQPKIYL